MTDTRTIRLNAIADEIEADGNYTAARSIRAITSERDVLRGLVIALRDGLATGSQGAAWIDAALSWDAEQDERDTAERDHRFDFDSAGNYRRPE